VLIVALSRREATWHLGAVTVPSTGVCSAFSQRVVTLAPGRASRLKAGGPAVNVKAAEERQSTAAVPPAILYLTGKRRLLDLYRALAEKVCHLIIEMST
jgi:hypothetical protein